MAPRHFTIRVPATSANLGPGFDAVGLSLALYLTLAVTVGPSDAHPGDRDPRPPVTLSYSGEGAADVPLDPYRNLITRVALYVLRCHAVPRLPPATAIHVHNEIPFGRGLGSSGAAVVAGVLLADRLAGLGLPAARLLDFCLMVERHPDNVAAALVGGFVGAYLADLPPAAADAAAVPLSEVLPEYPPDAGEHWGRNPPVPPPGIARWLAFPWSPAIRALAIVPRFELSTATARDVLPAAYARKDVVFNLQRLAVLTSALGHPTPDPDLIYDAMKDSLHQPYRNKLVPGLPEVTTRITPRTHPGLLGICLSGAGPTILALATANFDAIAADATAIFREMGVQVDCKLLDVGGGSLVEEDPV